MGPLQTSLVNVLIALAGVVVTVAFGVVSQRRMARSDYVDQMEKSLKEQLAYAISQKAALETKVAALELVVGTLRDENFDLMRRLRKLENGQPK